MIVSELSAGALLQLAAFLLINAPNCHLSLVLASVVQGDAVNCNRWFACPSIGYATEALILRKPIIKPITATNRVVSNQVLYVFVRTKSIFVESRIHQKSAAHFDLVRLINWCRPVVLNHCFEGRMRLPSTLCAALSSLSIKPLIFCVTDFILQ